MIEILSRDRNPLSDFVYVAEEAIPTPRIGSAESLQPCGGAFFSKERDASREIV